LTFSKRWQTIRSLDELDERIARLESRLDMLADALEGLRRLANTHLANDARPAAVEPPSAAPRSSSGLHVVPHHASGNGRSGDRTVLVITTDITTQPSRLLVHCTEPVIRAEITAPGLVLAAAIPLRADPRVVQVDVASPPFTPDSPLWLTVVSQRDVAVSAVERVY